MPEAPPVQKTQEFPCPSCSAKMVFDPQSGQMKCPYCGSLQAIQPDQTDVQRHSLEEVLSGQKSRTQTIGEGALQANCASCGGAVVFVPPEVAGACSFCGSAIVAEPKAADPLVAPDGVLPASVPKADAQASVQQWLSSRWFAPNSLKKIARQEGISGVYLPFWTYDSNTQSSYVGERGEYYYETEYYEETDDDGNRVTRSREVQRTAWYPAAGQVARRFDDVLVPATRTVNEHRLNKLQPWNLGATRLYEPAFLAGFKAQRYQVELADGFTEAQARMRSAIESDVRQDIGGDEQRIVNLNVSYSNNTFRHLLLPVWIGAYRFQQKAYQVIVNAQTAEVQGERPYSVVKIGLLVLAIILLLILFSMMSGSPHRRFSDLHPIAPPSTFSRNVDLCDWGSEDLPTSRDLWTNETSQEDAAQTEGSSRTQTAKTFSATSHYMELQAGLLTAGSYNIDRTCFLRGPDRKGREHGKESEKAGVESGDDQDVDAG
ncbi:MAG TPA: hypothetical protein VKZ53_27010 [Candidatus Angelobacter sp.]|nr:hypothetical protein [Candidatus Angelobacter sp.]